MWIEVQGGLRRLWVQSDKCLLQNGDLAFVHEVITPLPPPPAWLEAPKGSKLRQQSDMRGIGWPLIEHRSMRGSADDLLAFYGGLVERAGLVRTEWRPLVGFRGLSAENGEHTLGITVYERKDLVFWTFHLGTKRRGRSKVLSSRIFVLLAQDQERVVLRHESSGEEYWAPIDALTDTEPTPVVRPQMEPITWSLLPEWVQFGFESGTQGRVHRYQDQNGEQRWNASVRKNFEGSPEAMFEFCLDSLDSFGFDASGTDWPEHNYFVSLAGPQWTAFIQSEKAAAGLTVEKTLGSPCLFVCYSPSPGVTVPVPT